MRVEFIKYQYIYMGRDEDLDLPIIKKEPILKCYGSIVSTVMMKMPDTLGSLVDAPHFIIAVDDGTFETVPVCDCKRDRDELYTEE